MGALEAAAAAGAAAAEAEAVAVDLGQAFLHAFIIPNYKARTLLCCAVESVLCGRQAQGLAMCPCKGWKRFIEQVSLQKCK